MFAARDRRQRESDLYQELQGLVPLSAGSPVNHVDRIAVLRLAVAQYKLRDALNANKLRKLLFFH